MRPAGHEKAAPEVSVRAAAARAHDEAVAGAAGTSSAASLLEIQRAAGNAAATVLVQRALAGGPGVGVRPIATGEASSEPRGGRVRSHTGSARTKGTSGRRPHLASLMRRAPVVRAAATAGRFTGLLGSAAGVMRAPTGTPMVVARETEPGAASERRVLAAGGGSADGRDPKAAGGGSAGGRELIAAGGGSAGGRELIAAGGGSAQGRTLVRARLTQPVPIEKPGVVDQDDAEGKHGGTGTKLYDEPDGTIIGHLGDNEKLTVIEELADDWYHVAAGNQDGYAKKQFVALTPEEDPDAQLYRITVADKLGLYALVSKRYGPFKERSILHLTLGDWGWDARFYANVVVYVNSPAMGDRNYIRGPFTRKQNGREYVDYTLDRGKRIWLPGRKFADMLHGTVPSGSESRTSSRS